MFKTGEGWGLGKDSEASTSGSGRVVMDCHGVIEGYPPLSIGMTWQWKILYPIGSVCMVDWCQQNWGILMVNVTIYTIHGSYGYWFEILRERFLFSEKVRQEVRIEVLLRVHGHPCLRTVGIKFLRLAFNHLNQVFGSKRPQRLYSQKPGSELRWITVAGWGIWKRGEMIIAIADCYGS